jgi:signal transduction histidine kinase/DNA-binding response OmpR family regulator
VHAKHRFTQVDLSENITYRMSAANAWEKYSPHHYLRTQRGENRLFLQIQLPKFQKGQNAIYIETIDIGGKFYFEGKEIYNHGEWNDKNELNHFANFFSHLILVPPEANGKVIDAEIYADWKSIGVYGEILLGNEKDLIEKIYSKQLPSFAFSFFYAVAGLSAFIMFWLAKDYLLFYFSFSSLSLAIVCLAEVDLNLTDYNWHEFSAFLGLHGFFGLVYFFTQFLAEIFGPITKRIMKYYSYLIFLTYIYALYIINTYGFTREYCDRFEIQGGIIAGIGAVISVSVAITQAIRKDKNARILVIGLFFFFTTFAQYILFQFELSEKNASDVHLRFFPVMISLIWMIALRYRDNLQTLQKYTILLEESKQSLEQRVKEKTIGLEIANSQLMNASRSKSDFFANISHEFKTPLTLILSPLEKLSKKNSSEEDLFLISIMHRNTMRIQALVDDLLTIAKIDFGVFPKQKIDVELRSYFNNIIDEFKILCEEKKIEFNFYENTEHSFYKIDKHQWDLILRNVLSNAVKFTKLGSIDFAYSSDASHVQIKIKDTGIGIADEEIEFIFDRFYQSERSKKVSAVGTGIGLYLVKEMVKDCGGTLDISSAIDKGTEITLTLPVFTPDSNKIENIISRPNYLNRHSTFRNSIERKYKILVVEDEPSMAEYLLFLLKDDFNVSKNNSIDSALENIQMFEYDLILSDWSLPGKPGSILLTEVKKKNKNIPFLFLTARTEEHIVETAFQLGADDFIKKPFQAEDLISRIYQKIKKSKEYNQDLIQEKDTIYGDIHDLLGGKLTDLILQINQMSLLPEFSSDQLKNIKETATTLSKELRNRLHEWEDFRNVENDFELGWMSMIVRRYSNSGRTCRIILDNSLNWKDAESWSMPVKTEIFRMSQEFANNDLKYGTGTAYWEITEITPSFKLQIKTKTTYSESSLKGRGSRNLQERANRLGASFAYSQNNDAFIINFYVPKAID